MQIGQPRMPGHGEDYGSHDVLIDLNVELGMIEYISHQTLVIYTVFSASTGHCSCAAESL